MKNSLKSISVENLQSAISAAVSALIGQDCTVEISQIHFKEGLASPAISPSVTDLTITITSKPPKPNESTPY